MEKVITPKYSSAPFLRFSSKQEEATASKYSDASDFLFRSQERSHYRLDNRPRLNYQNEIPDMGFKNFCIVERNVPWKRESPYSLGVIGLHEEINDFYEKMCPTEEEKEVRLRVVEHITRIVHSLWPNAEVQVFGSFRTGLYLPSSDIDIVIIGRWNGLPLQTLSQALQQNGISETDICVIATAKVPIVRLKHTPSKIKVDISFNKKNGVEGALLVKKLMKEYPPLPKLVLVLKQFLVQRSLNEVYNGGMSSYCLTLLIVSLLQGFHKPKTEPSVNLGTLLLEFFEHYGINFNHKSVSIHFENGGNYQSKYCNYPILCVEDPLVKGNNVGKGTYLIDALKQAFENAFLLLHKAVIDSSAEKIPMKSYLGLIVNVEESLLKERQWQSQNYTSILKKLTDLTSEFSVANHSEGKSSTDKRKLKKKKRC